MNREEVLNEILSLKENNICCELTTGFGKTRIAIELLKKRNCKQILIVIPRLVLIQNWKEELKKWNFPLLESCVIFTTYVSLHKHAGKYDAVVYDECFRGDTEILTSTGYKRFDALTENDLVAQWLDNGNIEFVKPIRLIKKEYDGEICKVHLKRGRYVYMTPNHNQVYRTKQIPIWREKPIKELSFHFNTEIPTSGIGTGDSKDLSDLERLIIAIQADGSLQRHQINESVYSIQLTKDRKIQRFLQITKNLSVSEIKARIGARRWLCKLPKGDAKLLSTFFDINMGYNRARQFIEEIIEWDGAILQGNNIYYSSKVKENADFVAAIAVQAGYEVFQSIEEDKRKETYSIIHRVFMKNRCSRTTQCMNKEFLPYKGYVYCVEVPSHKIVVRSEGVTFISGNCHHLTERCFEAIEEIESDNNILLSATIPRDKKYSISYNFPNTYFYKVSLKEAIDNEVLPDPKVYLIPLELDKKIHKYNYIANPKGIKQVTCNYENRWNYIKDKRNKVTVFCTEWQYIHELSTKIEYYKRAFMTCRNERIKSKWLKLAGDRLKILSNLKTDFVSGILKKLKNERTITFCNSIEQTEVLGKYNINSKNKESANNLSMFNKGKIKHITCVNMLNEGINLYDCKVGIFAVLNSSEIMIKQKNGRLLRHPEPVIIIPYYINTREQELVEKMLEDYNPELVTTTDINNIKL